MRKDAAIAIVGMACRLPGARSTTEFWENVVADRCSIRPLPPDRFHHERYYHPEVGAYGKSYSAIGGIVDDFEIDAQRLGQLDAAAAQSFDVAHRWALDVARATFDDARIDPVGLRGKNVGVLIGHARGSMLTSDLAFATAVEGIARTAPGMGPLGATPEVLAQALEIIRRRYPTRTGGDLKRTLAGGLAGRIALSFGLSGRHAVVDAACASSFAAMDAASRALCEGRMDAALVGGASYSQELSVVLFAQSRALSADGSFPFDERANGFISSDGLGFFLLMRLEDAIASKARIRAVLRAVGGSCDGKGKALWAPRKEGQVLAMRRAYEGSGLDPRTIGLLEAHATSTPIGDATEIGALEEVFGAARKQLGRPLPIGSVKGNIGHTRETAGAAGMIKAIMALESGTLPPTGSFRTPSKSIPWNDVSSEVITAPRPFAASGSEPRRAGVNAFGIGGLNYHVIVEEAPPEHRVFPVGPIAPSFTAKKEKLDIAIVGIGGRFPEASNIGAYWARIAGGEPAFTEAPPERWSAEIYVEPGPAKPYRTYTARGAFLRDFAPDWRRYKMPPKLVDQNDPLQFMLLESASDALEDAGIDLGSTDRTRVATIMGTTFGSDYALELSLAIRAPELAEDVAGILGIPGDAQRIAAITAEVRKCLPTINEDSSGSFSSSTLASRVAKTLDLMGPTYTMDSACAASLASLEAAAELLRSGRVDLAVYGGGDRAMRVQRFSTYAAAGVLSKSGRMLPFESGADGLLPGEGAAVLVLERLEDAVAKGRRIYGVVRAIGSASDGSPVELGVASPAGLSLAIGRALEDAGVSPLEVSYVEGHGAAVPDLDRAELDALESAYKTRDRSEPLYLGSVKRIFGHSAGAAGAMAIAKAALMLDRGRVPPSTEGESTTVRPGIQLGHDESALGSGKVGVSSMSFGGGHYHVILEKAPEGTRKAAGKPELEEVVVEIRASALPQLLSAVDAGELFERRRLGNGPVVLTAVAEERALLEERIALFVKTAKSPGAKALLKKQGVFFREKTPVATRSCFLFSGQGSQYGGMMRAVAELVPAAKEVLDRADQWATAHDLEPISRVMFAPSIPNDVFWVQATLLVADVMAAAAAESVGVVPDVVTGHSFGDYAALVVAEAWTLETALKATLIRSRAIEATAEPGGMISVAATRAEVEMVLATLPPIGVVVPSNLNAPKQTVVSGAPEALEAASIALADRGFEVRKLNVPRAFHSPLMAGARSTLSEGLAKLELKAPRVPYLSSVTGAIETEPGDIRAALVEQLTRPVDFVAQIERLVAGNVGLFIECGPRGVLTGLTEQILADRGGEADVLSIDDAQRPGRFALARLAALVQSRRPSDAPVEQTSSVPLFVGTEAAELLEAEGFEDFWSKSQDSLRTLVRGLWSAEKAAQELERERRKEEARRLAEAEALAAQASQRPRRSVAPGRASVAPGRASVVPGRASVVPGPAVVAVPIELPPREEIQKFLIDALATQTGYPTELIDPDADLEADLGIDTVKQAQVLGKVRDKYQLRSAQSVSLADFPTVNKILAYVERQIIERSSAESTRPARPRVPVVDLTARRSSRPSAVRPEPTPVPPVAFHARETLTPAEPPPPRLMRHESLPAPRPPAPPTPAPLPVAPPSAAPPTPAPLAVAPPPAAPPTPAPVFSGGDRGGLQAIEVEARRPAETTEARPRSPSIVLELSGTSRQIGRQHGEALREVIRETMDRYEAFLGERNLLTLAVPEATRVLPSLFDPATLEELRGLAEAVGVPFEHLLAYNLDAALFPAFTPGCTQAVRTAKVNGGRLLHGANEDSPLTLHLGLPQTRTVQIRRRTDGPAPERTTVLFSLAGQIAGPNAVNDAGITVTGCTLLDGPPPGGLPHGVPHPQLVKQVAEGSKSLAEAVAIAEKVDRSGRWCLLVSSAAEDRAIALEYDDRAVLSLTEIGSDYVSTNHSLGGAPERAPTHSRYRLERARQLFLGRELDADQMQSGLRDRFDLARGRAVKHATMSTVRRVDNVMSLVVDPAARRLYVTDRIEEEEAARFLTIDYGDTPRSVVSSPNPRAKNGGLPAGASMQAEGRSGVIQSVASLSREGLGLVPVTEVMRRSVVRVVTEDAPVAIRSTRPASLLLIGRGAQAEAIARTFTGRGTRVVCIAEVDDAIAALSRGERFEALGLVAWPISSEAPFEIEAGAFAARSSTLLLAPFRGLQLFASATPKGLIFAVTHLGGGLGFSNLEQGSAEHGGWVGLLKAIRREHEGMEVALLDTSAGTAPEQVSAALFAELDAGCPRLEVGLLRSKRVRLAMPLRPADDFTGGAERLPRTWIVSGGARGVTAAIVRRLAELYRPSFHLIGRHVLPSEAELAELVALDDAGFEAKKHALLAAHKGSLTAKDFAAITEGWAKSVEIDRNMRALRALGAEVRYHAADVADAAQVARVVAEARTRGAIEGIIHGAGIEVAKPFAKKSEEVVRATVDAKVGGLVHLLRATRAEPITHVVAFSSVSGRFGGHGQTDYSLANDAMSRVIGAYRIKRPEVRAAAIAWPAWSEVGLAARSSAKAFLEQSGQAFMSPAEGANHFVRELWSGLREPEITISEKLEALDLDRLLVSDPAAFQKIATAVEAAPLLGRLVLSEREPEERVTTERLLSADEPFLDQHRMGNTPILPGVIALEILAELAALESERYSVGDLVIHQPLKLQDAHHALVRSERRGEKLRLTMTALRPDGVVLEPDRVFATATRLARRPIPRKVLPEWDGAGSHYPYPAAPDLTPGSRAIFHGPPFRVIEAIMPLSKASGLARLVIPPAEALVRGSRAASWRVPAALLDGCLQTAGFLSRLLFGVFALPAGFGRVDVAPRALTAAGERCTLEVQLRAEGDEMVSDLYVALGSEPILLVERYRARVVTGS